MSLLRRLTGVDEVHAALPGHPLLRCELGDPAATTEPVLAFVADDLPGTVALVRRRWSDDRLNAIVLGDPTAASALAGRVVSPPDGSPREPGLVSLQLPRGAAQPAVDGGVTVTPRPAWGWDWLWTDHPPAPVPGEDAVVGVEDDAVRALLERWYPDPGRAPGHPKLGGWLGVQDGGDGLLACGKWKWHGPRHAHLSTIVVVPQARGQGLGAAVTSALVRRLLDGSLAPGQRATTVGLGVYPDNAVALRLYGRLGFRVGARFDIWWVEDGAS